MNFDSSFSLVNTNCRKGTCEVSNSPVPKKRHETNTFWIVLSLSWKSFPSEIWSIVCSNIFWSESLSFSWPERSFGEWLLEWVLMVLKGPVWSGTLGTAPKIYHKRVLIVYSIRWSLEFTVDSLVKSFMNNCLSLFCWFTSFWIGRPI